MTPLVARFNGWCLVCKTRIDIGEHISWLDHGGFAHARCMVE